MNFAKINPYGSYGHMKINNNIKSYGHMSYESDKYDEVVDNFKHLRDSDEYRKLHIYHARRLGVDKFYELARRAETEGKHPGKLFTALLKREQTNE